MKKSFVMAAAAVSMAAFAISCNKSEVASRKHQWKEPLRFP